MAVIIAGERSGMGKTTVTLALLAAMRSQNQIAQSFKVGTMFHSHITGRACRNLDPVLTSEQYMQSCCVSHSRNAEYAWISNF